MQVSTIPGLLLNLEEKYRKSCALKFKEGEGPKGTWIDVSTDDLVSRVEDLFFGLRALGVNAGDRIAILSENRPEWAIADYAAASAGAVTVPIYTTLSSPQIETLLKDSEASVVFVSNAELLEKIKAVRFHLPAMRHVVVFNRDVYQPGAVRLDTLYRLGRQLLSRYPGEFRRSAAAIDPEDVATIIYTSGTTGVPKGAMLTHRNVISNIQASVDVLPITSTDTTLSFLPLSHIFQRHVDYACAYTGATIAYAHNLNLLAEEMAEVRPTFAAGVPRFFEKVYRRILSQARESNVIRRTVFETAVRGRQVDSPASGPSIRHRLAERFVFQKIRKKFGGRLRWFISGGAPLEGEIAAFFYAVGLPIFEGYGLTETSPVIALNGPSSHKIGSVGRPVGDVEVRVAPDGEILVRGSNVMRGYYRMPKETEAAFHNGWFRTGDIGRFDTDGFLRVTDRKKDLIVTSTGKNVAPQPIENRLKLISYFENVVVIGDGRNFISALIVPNYEALEAYARQTGIHYDTRFDLIHRQEIHDLAMREIGRQTQDFAAFEKIKRIAFLAREFTIDAGEITPTMKIRRLVIEKKYKADIDELYAA